MNSLQKKVSGEAFYGKKLLFNSFENMFKSKSTMHDVINNIWLFVPLGAALYKPGSRRWLIPSLISVLVEVIQLVTGIGTFEAADIVCNSLGGLTGYVLMTKGRFICHPAMDFVNNTESSRQDDK